jgi:hypothetical protein
LLYFFRYGQEFSFLPNNAIIRLDNDLANNFLLTTSGQNSKHHSRKNSYDPTNVVDINLLAKKLNNQKVNNDLLLNEEEFDEEPSTSQEVSQPAAEDLKQSTVQISPGDLIQIDSDTPTANNV